MNDAPEDFAQAPAQEASMADGVYASLYPQLRRIAHARLRQGCGQVSLETTALVHESYLRFVQSRAPHTKDRAHFLAYASKVMRSVIVDLIRESNAERRGGGQRDVTLDTLIAESSPGASADEALEVHAALGQLESVDPRMVRVVEMRYFAGLNDSEIAECLGVTTRTVARDWEKARVFLHTLLKRS